MGIFQWIFPKRRGTASLWYSATENRFSIAGGSFKCRRDCNQNGSDSKAYRVPVNIGGGAGDFFEFLTVDFSGGAIRREREVEKGEHAVSEGNRGHEIALQQYIQSSVELREFSNGRRCGRKRMLLNGDAIEDALFVTGEAVQRRWCGGGR